MTPPEKLKPSTLPTSKETIEKLNISKNNLCVLQRSQLKQQILFSEVKKTLFENISPELRNL
jgi:hypothetical protein